MDFCLREPHVRAAACHCTTQPEVESTKRARLDRVTEAGPGAMGLEYEASIWGMPAASNGCLNQCLLCRTIWRC